MTTMKKCVRIAAPLSAVRDALFDAAALRVWLAEQAEVDLPDRYEFWGRLTPNRAAPRQHLRHVEDGQLRFDWELDGVFTTVDIGLSTESGSDEDRGSTLLTLTQTEIPGWPEMLTERGDRSLMHGYWNLTLVNLADYAEGRDPVGGCDFTSPVMRRELLIDADRQAVYASLTEPEQVSVWSGVKVEAELHPGGRWAMGGFAANPQPARIVDIQSGRSMSIDWGMMVQSWELVESGGGTQLTFVLSGFDETEPPYDGWLGSLTGLVTLRRYHEIKNWRPVWVEEEIEGLPDELRVQTDA
jgi:uncharacterized protein YndB with AHSA1/START domain